MPEEQKAPTPEEQLKMLTGAVLRMNVRLSNIETYCRELMESGESPGAFQAFMSAKYELGKKFNAAENAAAVNGRSEDGTLTEPAPVDEPIPYTPVPPADLEPEEDEPGNDEPDGKHVVADDEEGEE